jgi:hypothetical protein
MSGDDLQQEIDELLDQPPSLNRVLQRLSSEDPGTRADAGAAADVFVREQLGLTWDEVAAAIGLAASLRAQKTAPPHPDTKWRLFFDEQCQMGFGRHFRGRIIATKEHSGTGHPPKWSAAIDGQVLRDATGQPQLFPDMDASQHFLEASITELSK